MTRPGPEAPPRRRSRKLDVIRVVVVLILLGVGAWYVRGSGVLEFLERETLRGHVDELGGWGVAVYFGAWILLVTFLGQTFVPTVAGGVMFGWLLGGLMAFVGAVLGHTAQYLVARSALRGPAESLLLRRYPQFARAIEERGLAVLVVLRFAWAPAWAVNLASGVTGVRLRDHLLALPAVIPSTLLVCLISDSVFLFGWSAIPAARWGAMAAILVGGVGFYFWATRRWPELRLKSGGAQADASSPVVEAPSEAEEVEAMSEVIRDEERLVALAERIELPGGAFTARCVVAEDETEVEGFGVIGSLSRPVILRPGEPMRAGAGVVRLLGPDPQGGVRVRVRGVTPSRAEAPLGESFELTFGRRVRLPGGVDLELTWLSDSGGVELLVAQERGGTRFWCFESGFCRIDGLLVEVVGFDPSGPSVRLIVRDETRVERVRPARFGEVQQVRLRDVLEFPGGATLRLGRVTRAWRGETWWRLLVGEGRDRDDVPLLLRRTLRPYDGRDFRFLGRPHRLRMEAAVFEPEVTASVVVEPEELPAFELGGSFELGPSDVVEGPDGLLVGHGGVLHGHGVTYGALGREEPCSFATLMIWVRSGAEHDVLEFELPDDVGQRRPSLLGVAVTLLELTDETARVTVEAR